jgi:acetyl-CoA carboxylase biotin carboxyl carrier protein
MADDGAVPEKRKSHAPEGRLDLRDVKRLVHLMDLHGLAEVELEDEGRRLRLRKGGSPDAFVHQTIPGHAVPAPVLPAVPVGPAPGASPAPSSAPAAGGAAKGIEIRSPMVGTFYRSPSPEAAPFAEVGDAVRKEMVVCIIEAMKVMNEIKSEVEGEVLAVLVQNGEAVEFDQPLFLLKPPGAAG